MMYRGIELCDMPSGMGGTLPAAISHRNDDNTTTVICLHPEFFTDYVLTPKTDDLRPLSYRLTDKMKRIIDRRVSGRDRRLELNDEAMPA